MQRYSTFHQSRVKWISIRWTLFGLPLSWRLYQKDESTPWSITNSILFHSRFPCTSMGSKNVFSTLYDMMRDYHSYHHQALLSMQQQCKKAKTVKDLHRLASDISSFCHSLHVHHTIEDRRLFPQIALKIDISHLETHHEQLAQILIEFENFSRRLKQLKTSDEDINGVTLGASSLVNKVSTLVNEHERAEEKVLEPDNMKKWFTENEMKRLFHI